MDTTHSEERWRHYLPSMRDGNARWINIKGWHKIIAEYAKHTINNTGIQRGEHGRILVYSDYVLFEDERDAMMFRLGLNG